MNTTIVVTYNTSRPSNDPRSYALKLGIASDPTHDLRQVGPVSNGVVLYRGTYTARRDALQAALDLIDAQCVLIEHADPMAGSVVHSVQRAGYMAKGVNRAIARRLATGDWIAA